MSSPWRTEHSEAVADKVLKRVEVSKMARKLQNRLALAQFKTKHGWEDLTLDLIEPKVEEQLRRKRPSSSGDVLSDSSSTISDFQYPRALLSSSPLKEPIFSDALASSSGSSGHRKRTCIPLPSSGSFSRKRFRSSPTSGRALDYRHTAWKDNHQLAQSSPIKARKEQHFTTTTGPNLSFFRGNSPTTDVYPRFSHQSDEDDDLLPVHSFNKSFGTIRSSPPRTPPPVRRGAIAASRSNGKVSEPLHGEEGADLLMFLATSPSPAKYPSRNRMDPPSTPPPRNQALPSSMMTTPGGGSLLSAFGAPHTPSQNFDFSDFVNITPSPAQNAWAKTPGTVRTPMTVGRRHLNFDNFLSPGVNSVAGTGGGNPSGKRNNGLGMQLGEELIS